MIDYPRGFTREKMWEAIKNLTRHSTSISSENMRLLARIFEQRRILLGLEYCESDREKNTHEDVKLSLKIESGKGRVTDRNA